MCARANHDPIIVILPSSINRHNKCISACEAASKRSVCVCAYNQKISKPQVGSEVHFSHTLPAHWNRRGVALLPGYFMAFIFSIVSSGLLCEHSKFCNEQYRWSSNPGAIHIIQSKFDCPSKWIKKTITIERNQSNAFILIKSGAKYIICVED